MKFMRLDATRKKIGWLAAIILAAAVGYSAFYLLRTLDKPVIRIGVLHSLSGTMALSETPLVDALRMAVEEVNQAGGVNGAQVEMVVEDCRSDAAYCAGRAEKLISEDHVQALFGCWTSACRKAVKAVVERHQHLLFYPLQHEGLEKSRAIVYTGAVPNQQIVPMVSWAMQQHGKRVYLIGSDYVFPRTANGIVKSLLQARGGVTVAENYVPLGFQDMDAIARDIAAKHPDFVVNTLNGDSNRAFFKALHKAGVLAKDTPVFSTSLAEAELAAIGPELVAGHYAAWNYFQSIDSADNRAFIEHFRRRFGANRVLDDPMEASYIALLLWAQAANSSGTAQIASVKTHLETDSLRTPEGIVSVDGDTMHLWKLVRIGCARVDGQFDIVWQSRHSLAPAPFPFFLSHEETVRLMRGAQ
jgi:urea transport system substrate-binding protein